MGMRRKQSELVGIMKKKCRALGLLKESNNRRPQLERVKLYVI